MSNNTQQKNLIWHSAGGDNSRRGLFPQTVRIASKPSYTLKARGAVQASVVFNRQGTAFIADMSGSVQAFEEKQEKWQIQLDGGISSTPAVHPNEDRLFVATHTGWVYALQSSNGDPVWKKEIPSKSDPRILSDLLYLPRQNALVLNSWGGKYYSLNANNGDTLFSWDAGISPYAGASADLAEVVYCLRSVWDKGTQFVRVSPSGDETILYTQPLQKKPASRIPVSAAPVIDEKRGTIYFIANLDQESLLHAWSIRDKRIIWSYRFPKNVLATPALMEDGTIVTASLDGFVHAVASGPTIVYRYASGCEYLLSGAICDASGTAYAGDPLGCIHHIRKNGLGQSIFEVNRAIQVRPSMNPAGDLFIPSTDRGIYIITNAR